MLRCVFNLLILGLVSSMIDEAITANTNRVRVSNQPWAASPLLRNTFDGADDQLQDCQCVIFYLCEEANTIKNDTICEESSQVCCKTDSTVVVDDIPSPVPNSESTLTSVSTSEEPQIDSSSSPTSTSTESSIIVDSNSSPSSTPTPQCGIRKGNGQSSSSDISFGEFPWMVAILRTSDNSPNGTVICGGSLLSRNVVLTAAHCVHNIDNLNTVRIRAGDYIINGDTDERLPHQERTASVIITHANYSSKVLHNDLALISVREPFTFDDHIAPACLPFPGPEPTSDPYNSQDCLVTGWTRNTDNTVQNKLRKVSANVLMRENCENNLRETRLGRTFKLHPSFLCAKEQESVCKGHGGGPLVCASTITPNKYVQVGVVSWGIGCDSNLPGVYASLESNSEWLVTQYNVVQVFAN